MLLEGGYMLLNQSRTMLLRAEEEREKFRRLTECRTKMLDGEREGGPNGRRRAARWRVKMEAVRDELVEANLPLVVTIISRHAHFRRLPRDEALAEGAMALVRAVDNFEPKTGYKFGTFAWTVVKNALIRLSELHLRPRRLGEEVDFDITAESRAVNGTGPCRAELADLERVLECNEAELTPVEMVVIRRRYGLSPGPETLEAIGQEIGVTKERVRQIQKAALRKLGKVMDP